MSVTSGFFNSLNGDRRYNAEQMSSIFNGIINDGVFASIGDGFTVKAAGSNNITVGIGRAWFNSAWLLNDAILPIEAPIPEVVLERYDAVVIEINYDQNVRSGSIKIVKGTPSSTPDYPEMANTVDVHQYPLAYIHRKASANEITQADITNMVGTSSCPYITGILQVQNIDKIVAQWEAQWNQWFASQTGDADSEMTQWMNDSKAEFNTWFNELQLTIEGEVALQLANQIIEIQNRLATLYKDHSIHEAISDFEGDVLLDSNGNAISGKTSIATLDDVNEVCNQRTPFGIVITLFSDKWVEHENEIYYNAKVLGVKSNNNIMVSPNPLSYIPYAECMIRAVNQGRDTIRFVADSIPEQNVMVNILVFDSEVTV